MDCVGCKQAQVAMSNPLPPIDPDNPTRRFRRLLDSDIDKGWSSK
jgi:hypothetical protein